MKPPRSIRAKLLWIALASVVAALVLAGVVLGVAEHFRQRRDLARDLRALAAIVADNTNAALAFDDPAAAAETLRALRAKPNLVAGCLYSPTGALFASYLRPGAAPALASCPPAVPAPGEGIGDRRAEIAAPVELPGGRRGVLYLRSDLRGIATRMRLQGWILAATLLLAGAAAMLLALRLQRLISQPVIELAGTARRVSSQGDYSLRAVRHSDDELGDLVDGFNRMLAQIQSRDEALSQANEGLERRVGERTRELAAELVERRRAEAELAERNRQLAASNRELDDFAYVASHDLKEPLRGIHNYAGFLLEDHRERLGDDGRAKLETLMRLSKRMESLINSLLHYSRVGRVDLAVEEVDLQQVVDELLDSLSITLEEAGAVVSVERPLPVVRCDRARIDEVFRNLVVNAVKYNDRSEKQVEIGWLDEARAPRNGAGAATDEPPAAGERVAGPVFYVRDDGIGIRARHHRVIFDIFKRLHQREAYGGGTGAGLTIVEKVVGRHGGRIWVDSSPGEGSTFYFTLGTGGGDA